MNNYRILKELNKGYNGIAYLIEKDDEIIVVKLTKILKPSI